MRNEGGSIRLQENQLLNELQREERVESLSLGRFSKASFREENTINLVTLYIITRDIHEYCGSVIGFDSPACA